MERCTTHSGESIQLFCRDCDDKPVCNTCITTRHSGHKFRKSSEVKEEILAKLRAREKKEENATTKQKLEQTHRKQKGEIDRQNENKSRMCLEIERRRKEIKREIDKLGNQIEEKCRKHHSKNIAYLQKNCDCIKQEIKKRSQYDASLQKLISMDRISDLIRHFELADAPTADELVVSDIPSPCRFVPGKCDSLSDIFGHFEEHEKDHYETIGYLTHRYRVIAQPTDNDDGAYASMTPSRCSSLSLTSEAASVASLFEDRGAGNVNDSPRLQPISSHEIKTKSVIGRDAAYIVLSGNSDQCWVKCPAQNEITLVNRFGKEMQKPISFSDRIGGFTNYLRDELLVCLPEKKIIRKVDRYSASDFISTAPFVPRCVHSSLFDGEIVAIVYDPGTSRVNAISELVRYNSNGVVERQIRNDTFGNNLFHSPDKISFNRTGKKMAVINFCGPTSSHLLILNRNLELLWRYFGDNRVYRGNENCDLHLLQSDTNMCLTDVVFDNKDNVVIADRKTNTVKMLNHRMEPLCVLGTYNEAPMALAMVHHNQTLWIKFDSGKLSVVNHTAPPSTP